MGRFSGWAMTGRDQAGLFLRTILINLVGIFLLDLMGLIIKHLSGDYGAAELSTQPPPPPGINAVPVGGSCLAQSREKS